MPETKLLGDTSVENNGNPQSDSLEHLSQLLEHYLALLDQRINFPSKEDSLVPSFELAQSRPVTPKPESETDLASDNTPPSTQKRSSNDPLYWFGILVPPALRTAQREFIGAVDVLPNLVSVINQMDSYERKIEEARKGGKSLEH
ncbi:hypothetical protein GP486_000999 [Trichoglossum hirsutum]|uniref:Vacuolar ATPase assembly protein VMA22 n=1 Tax=Trichoglossum hirsutum TaxID=265104 RepID=A0A9P8LHI4_9PEZI|nr:hypothetical protein GP486_000999 [Trichoglossum hirsutum]